MAVSDQVGGPMIQVWRKRRPWRLRRQGWHATANSGVAPSRIRAGPREKFEGIRGVPMYKGYKGLFSVIPRIVIGHVVKIACKKGGGGGTDAIRMRLLA